MNRDDPAGPVDEGSVTLSFIIWNAKMPRESVAQNA